MSTRKPSDASSVYQILPIHDQTCTNDDITAGFHLLDNFAKVYEGRSPRLTCSPECS